MAPNDTQRPRDLPKDPEKRRRELQRRKLERQAAIRAQKVAENRKRTAIIGASVIAVAAVVIGTVAFWPSSKPKPAASASTDTASSTPSAAPSSTAAKATYTITPKKNAASWKTEPAMTIDTSGNYTAKINFGQGAVDIKLDAKDAPHTVNSFVFLANQHFFDGIYCHRLTTQGLYVLQCGDPTGTGSGGPGYQFKDENLSSPTLKGGNYPAGTVAMANSGANTNGSQFFLVYKDSPLPANYTPFGTITGGLDVLNAIAAKGENDANGPGDGMPINPVIMNTVTAAKN
ncbi:peptidylprolyl isomerase [Streptacidiphilus jiangxiensis]|uniref:Peptidyl-prolyl cis-trans isomerase n=1 Tax=Streptacidiphilus jiangxiensis TaxID=235985 RepID=A0A1H7ZIN7_STRJI|nr:peptidylprolyl isomerase [Streptacidiphilus jiangxiensis]SEM58111.1 peptidyl-prolyl cis-trans isomerase B (cyclophilin B) [Streptacidiphilus jiangxiensis]